MTDRLEAPQWVAEFLQEVFSTFPEISETEVEGVLASDNLVILKTYSGIMYQIEIKKIPELSKK